MLRPAGASLGFRGRLGAQGIMLRSSQKPVATFNLKFGQQRQNSSKPITHVVAQTKTNGHPMWGFALTLGAVSLVAGFAYANRPVTLRLDAPVDRTSSDASSGFLRPSSGLNGAPSKNHGPAPVKRTTVSDLQKAMSLDEISHRTGDIGLTTLELIDPGRLTQILQKNEEAVVVGGRTGVLRYDTNQIASNCPIEDDHSEAVISAPSNSPGASGDWMFWGVYDGHSGWATSAKLRQTLIPHVYNKLAEVYASATTPSDSEIDNAIKAGFLSLDHDIVWSSVKRAQELGKRQGGLQLLAPAISGSCALLSFYDTRSQLLRVACAGDCRAVLGRRVGGSTWSATQLSADQTGQNPDEAARINAEHPDEKDVVKNGRVMGYEPSRAFGDAVLKWPRDVSMALRKTFYARRPQDRAIKPPYMTAEPVITTTKIQPERGDFIVMASDSLWEILSNEEVVGLVGRWIDQGRLGIQQKQSSIWDMVPKFFGSDSFDSNVAPSKLPDSEKPFGQSPVRRRQWGIATKPSVPIVQDINVATHLVRNALGGDNHDTISSLILLGGTNARRFRDDLTITVVFFGQEE